LVLKEAYEAGVRSIVSLSMNLVSCQKSVEIKNATCQPKIYIGMGIHPAEASLSQLEDVVSLIKQRRHELSVIGEIGLDFWYKWARKDDEKRNEQRTVFRRLLKLAHELNLPAVIHSRGAWRECLETALEMEVKKAEFHWYSGPLDVLDDILRAGYYVSTSPSVAYSLQSREAMLRAPVERTLIETDCPVYYKNSETGEAFQATPKDVFRTLEAYSRLKNLREEEALTILNKNAEDFFGIGRQKEGA